MKHQKLHFFFFFFFFFFFYIKLVHFSFPFRSEISSFQYISVNEQAKLCQILSETPEADLHVSRLLS